jgi:predicted GNAT superfamily acetyltransferase
MSSPVAIRPARDRSDADACVELQRRVWGLADLEITPAIQLIATSHAGGLLHVAEAADGEIVGFAYAFPAIRGGTLHLHSDMLAVLPARRGQGLGVRLKHAQRDAARTLGIPFITWTFDPLQALNARLNLRRLGARGIEFLPNLYGVTSSSLHHGLPTHRLLVRWDVEECGAPERAPARPEAAAAATRVEWRGGAPVCSPPDLTLESPRLLLEIPADFASLLRERPEPAREWHTHVCAALEHYLAAGWQVTDVIPADARSQPRPQLLLEKPDAARPDRHAT